MLTVKFGGIIIEEPTISQSRNEPHTDRYPYLIKVRINYVQPDPWKIPELNVRTDLSRVNGVHNPEFIMRINNITGEVKAGIEKVTYWQWLDPEILERGKMIVYKDRVFCSTGISDVCCYLVEKAKWQKCSNSVSNWYVYPLIRGRIDGEMANFEFKVPDSKELGTMRLELNPGTSSMIFVPR